MRVLQGVFIKSKCPHFAKGYKSSKYSTATVTKDEETSKPVYPPILDVSEIPTELRRKEKYYEKIKKMNTIEEKLLALNVARYYGWPSFHVREGSIPYNFLPLTQFITRTEIREVENLPVYLDNEETKKILAEIKPELEKVIVFENCGKSFKHELETVLLEENELPEIEKKNIKTKDIIFEINSAFCRILHRRYPHLFQAQVDYEPRLEAFWRVGGFYPTREDKKLRKEKGVSEARLGEYIDRFFQYYGSPILQLRSRLPLPEMKIDEAQIEPVKTEVSIALGENDEATDIVAVDEKPQLTNYALQEYRYDPKTYLQIPRERIHGAIIPGAWKANATGRNSNSMREFLEKNYKETSGKETVKLAIRALLEVVESGGKNIEIAVMTKEDGLRELEESEIDEYVAEIEAEKAAAEAAKKGAPKDA